MRKVIIGCAIAGILGIGLFILYIYMVLTPKTKDVSDVAPFAELMNRPVKTVKRTIIFEHPITAPNENYPYVLEDGTIFGLQANLKKIVDLPVGTTVTFDLANFITGGVSGTTAAYLYGTVFSEEKQQTYPFVYYWGDYRSLYEDRPYWFFGETFWLEQPLEEKFFIEVP